MKRKLLESSKLVFKLYMFYLGIKYKFFTKKNTYSQFGEDLIINKFFGDYIGKYVDIGCYHPIKYSNTAMLHKKGWKGVNIDLNETSINLFNACRKNDRNIVACLSDKKEKVLIYRDSKFSALNSIYLDNLRGFKFKKLIVKTKIFSELVNESFDFLNIDCEGSDYKILKSINLNKYKPKLVSIEVSKTDKNKIYKYLNSYGYIFFNKCSLSHLFKKVTKKKGSKNCPF